MGNLVRGTARVVEHADQNFLENTRIVGEAGATGHVAEAAESSLARTLEFRPAGRTRSVLVAGNQSGSGAAL